MGAVSRRADDDDDKRRGGQQRDRAAVAAQLPPKALVVKGYQPDAFHTSRFNRAASSPAAVRQSEPEARNP